MKERMSLGMIKGELGKTRKYFNGSTHEVASGKFKIVDRYLNYTTGKVYLKYEWISGDRKGIVESNKEENINASLYKFRQSRGIDLEENALENLDINKLIETMSEQNRKLTNIIDHLLKKVV